MASIYGAYSKYTRLRIDYSITQNIESNKSTINMNMYAERTKGSHQYVSGSGSYYTMTNKDKTDFTYNWSASSLELYIGSSSVEVAHADDGTASVTLSGYWNTYRTGSSYIPAELSVSSTITLPTIARKSQVTLSNTNINLGNSVTIYTNRASANFTHSLYYQIGSNNRQTIATGVTDNYSWNTNNAISQIASNFPNSSTGNLSIICETYNNGTYIGDTRATLNFSITSKPTVSSISKSGGINSIYVEDVSSVTTNVTASGIYGSSISTYRMEMYNGNTKIKENYGSSASATFNLTGLNLSADATITLKATVTDTRGNLGTGSTTIAVKDYFKPQITSRSAYRCNSSGIADSNGTYLRIYWVYSTKSISGVTTDTAKVQYRQKGASSWTSVTVANGGSVTVGGGAISTDYPYEVQFSISDNVSTPTVVTDTIPTGSVTVDYRAGGKGIAFGKVSEKDEFECAMDAEFTKNIKIQNLHDKNITLFNESLYNYLLTKPKTFNEYAIASTNGYLIIDTKLKNLYEMIHLKVIGNGYGAMPVDTVIQGYHYDTLGNFVNCKILNSGEKLSAWFILDTTIKIVIQVPVSYMSFSIMLWIPLHKEAAYYATISGSATFPSYTSRIACSSLKNPVTDSSNTIRTEKSLYENSSGTTGTVTLSETSANFTYLEIYYGDTVSGTKDFIKVTSPNGATLNTTITSQADNGANIRINTRQLTISGTTITPSKYQVNYTPGENVYTVNEQAIYKVVGYK